MLSNLFKVRQNRRVRIYSRPSGLRACAYKNIPLSALHNQFQEGPRMECIEVPSPEKANKICIYNKTNFSNTLPCHLTFKKSHSESC